MKNDRHAVKIHHRVGETRPPGARRGGSTGSIPGCHRKADQGASDKPQHGHASRNEAGPIHQVAQDQPVSDADNEAWPEYERPVRDRDERPGGRDERAGIRARSLGPQRNDRKETDDADGDEGAFSETSFDVSKSEAFVLALEDRKSTTADPMLAMMRMSSQTAPKRTRVSAPAPTMYLAGCSTGA
jgi:hypothetical protein